MGLLARGWGDCRGEGVGGLVVGGVWNRGGGRSMGTMEDLRSGDCVGVVGAIDFGGEGDDS